MRTYILALLGLLVGAVAHAALYDAPFEDAYITYRYAENLAAGQGLVYNPGEIVDGYSSPLWTVLLAGLNRIGLSLPAIAPIASLLCGLAAITIAASMAARQLGGHGPLAVVPAAVWVAHGGWAYFASSGMETMLFLLLLMGGLSLLTEPVAVRGAMVAGSLLALSAMTRPEGVAYVILIVVALLATMPRRAAWTTVGTFVALYVPYFAAHWVYYGSPFSNTYYAKASLSATLLVAGLNRTEVYLTSHGGWLALLATAFMVWKSKGGQFWCLVAAVELASIVTNVVAGGDTFAFHRFMLPLVPLGALAVIETVRARLLWTRPSGLLLGVCAACVWLSWTFAATYLPVISVTTKRDKSERQFYLDIRQVNDDYFTVGSWLGRNLPRRTVIATNAAGIVPYTSGFRTIDMLGLNDRHIAHRPIPLGHGVRGHEKHDVGYVLGREPDVILLGLPILAARHFRSDELEAWFGQWFDYLPGDREMFFSARFREKYAPTGIDINGRQLTLFVRRQN